MIERATVVHALAGRLGAAGLAGARRPLLAAAAVLAILFATSSAIGAPPHADTLIGPFVAGMSLAEADTIAATMRLRWIGRDVRFAGDSTLSLYEARDTSVRGVLVYGLTFERGRLHQVELHRSAPADDPAAFADWLQGFVRSLSASEPLGRFGDFERRCRPSGDGGAITTLLLLRGETATIIVCTGSPRVGCQRC
jgi:hypothetical protein